MKVEVPGFQSEQLEEEKKDEPAAHHHDGGRDAIDYVSCGRDFTYLITKKGKIFSCG